MSDHIEEIKVDFTVKDWNMLQRLASCQEETNRLLRDNTEATMRRIDALESSMQGMHKDAVAQIKVQEDRVNAIDKTMFQWWCMGSGVVLTAGVIWGFLKVAAPLIPILMKH